MRNDNVLLEKSKVFAIRIVRMYQYLSEERKEYTLSKQVLRSGTSIGANVREAVYGQSRKDFLAKMSIALKEAVETEYWLELLVATGYLDDEQYESIKVDSAEISRLLTSVVKTLRTE